MRKLLIVLLLMVMIPALAQEETETSTPAVPNLIGLTAPEAEAILNQQGLRLDPIFSLLDINESGGTANTIGDQSPAPGDIVDPGTIVSVSMIRSFNILLIYYNEGNRDFENAHFTFVNLSDEAIYIDGIRFQSDNGQFAAASWHSNTIDGHQCFQIWSNEGNGSYEPHECALRGVLDRGTLEGVSEEEHFWQNTDRFQIFQDGVYRASCAVALGRCELWVSPQAIAEDVTEYVYFVYNEHELFVLNHSPAQWMPLFEIRLDNAERTLNDSRLWSSITIPDLDFLAPGQCVYFADNIRDERLNDCFVIAESIVSANNAFWRDGFTVQSLYQEAIVERSCPLPSGMTFCLVPRYELGS